MILYGVGGHGKVVYDCLVSQGIALTGCFDDNPGIKLFAGVQVLCPYRYDILKEEKIIISIGENRVRYQLAKVIDHPIGEIVHKLAIVSDNSIINKGSMVMAAAVIQPGVQIGEHVIINTGVIIEHDCQIDGFVHIGPGAVLCGGVHVGKGALIGANATILPGVTIGSWAIVGAGAVVTKDVLKEIKVTGNPARTS